MKKNSQNPKTLIEMLGDPKLSLEDKNLLNELVGKSFEKDEDVDKDVRMNPNTLQ